MDPSLPRWTPPFPDGPLPSHNDPFLSLDFLPWLSVTLILSPAPDSKFTSSHRIICNSTPSSAAEDCALQPIAVLCVFSFFLSPHRP